MQIKLDLFFYFTVNNFWSKYIDVIFSTCLLIHAHTYIIMICIHFTWILCCQTFYAGHYLVLLIIELLAYFMRPGPPTCTSPDLESLLSTTNQTNGGSSQICSTLLTTVLMTSSQNHFVLCHTSPQIKLSVNILDLGCGTLLAKST